MNPASLASSPSLRVPVGVKPERVRLVDLNGDGKADAVAGSSESRAVVVLVAK